MESGGGCIQESLLISERNKSSAWSAICRHCSKAGTAMRQVLNAGVVPHLVLVAGGPSSAAVSSNVGHSQRRQMHRVSYFYLTLYLIFNNLSMCSVHHRVLIDASVVFLPVPLLDGGLRPWRRRTVTCARTASYIQQILRRLRKTDQDNTHIVEPFLWKAEEDVSK